MNYYNRYSEFTGNGIIKLIPFIKLTNKATDKTLIFEKGKHKTNELSYEYYGTPFFEWLIRLKNANLGMDEYEWPDNSVIVIPFPLKDSVQDFLNRIDIHKQRFFV